MASRCPRSPLARRRTHLGRRIAGVARAAFRTFAPWLRGYGPTRFLRDDTFRSGQLVALGQDLVDFANSVSTGTYWSGTTGARARRTSPRRLTTRVAACVALSVGCGANHPGQIIDYLQKQNYWYHWLMATPRGDRLVREDRCAFTRHIWNEWFVAYKPDAVSRSFHAAA